MYVQKISNFFTQNKYSEEQDSKLSIDADLGTLFKAIQGRLRFGSGTTGFKGENIGGVWLKIITSGTLNAEVGYKHNLESQPMGYIVVSQDKNGSLCGVPTGGGSNSVWTSGTAYFRSDGTSGNFLIFLLERGGQP